MASYSIKELENLSGIKAHTIRIWEKRYGIIKPARTDTNIRYYSDSNLRRLLNIAILNRYGMTGSVVHLEKVLHLKTGLSYLENNVLVASGEFLTNAEFKKYDLIEVPENESAAANCIWVNDTILLPKGYPVTKQKIKDTGYQIIELDISEFAKLDGGLSCLSLRF